MSTDRQLEMSSSQTTDCTAGCCLFDCYIHLYVFLYSGCTDDIMTSDHSPVYAAYQVGITSQFISDCKSTQQQTSVTIKSTVTV